MNQAHKVCSIRCHDWSADGHPAKLHKHNWHISTKLTNMYHKSLNIWYIDAISTIAEIKKCSVSALVLSSCPVLSKQNQCYQHRYYQYQYYLTSATMPWLLRLRSRQPEQPKGSRSNLRDVILAIFRHGRQWSPRVSISPRFKGDPRVGWDELEPNWSYLNHFDMHNIVISTCFLVVFAL